MKNKRLKCYVIKMKLFVHFGQKDRDATYDVLLTTFGQKDQHVTKGMLVMFQQSYKNLKKIFEERVKIIFLEKF